MARIRSIHPGLFTDEAFMTASPHARLLIIGLWTEAWDDGVFEWKPLTLKAKLFPVDAVDMVALLDELASLDFLRPFEAGKRFGAIRNFQKYQRPKKPNSSGVLPESLHSYVAQVPNQFPTGTEKSPQMEDGGGREGEDTASAVSERARLPYDEIETKCRKAAGLEQDPSPSLCDLSPVIQFLDAGADLERQILPVLRAKRRDGIRSWRFFVPSLTEALSAKPPVIAKPKTFEQEESWKGMLTSFAGGYWNDHWGPPPDSPNCKIPEAFIAANSTQPRTGKERDAA